MFGGLDICVDRYIVAIWLFGTDIVLLTIYTIQPNWRWYEAKIPT